MEMCDGRNRRQRDGRLADAVYRTAFEVSPLPICLFDLEGHYLQANEAFLQLVGARPEQVIGAHVSTFNEVSENEDSEQNLRDLGSGAVNSREIHRRLRTTDGRTVHVTARVTLLEHDGEPVGLLSMVSDITSHVEMEAELRQIALQDPLTGLATRQLLLPTLDELHQAGRPAGICFADLDGFKALNDRFGHQAADTVLASVGQRLRIHLALEDVAVRVGGDELVVVRPDVCDEAGAEALGRQVHDAITHTVWVAGTSISVSASVGIAFGDQPSMDLVGRADAAMYEAKRTGSGVQVATAGDPTAA